MNESTLDSVVSIPIHGEKRIATLNLVKGVDVYGENLVKYCGEEYRIWDPFRSKLAGALQNGLTNLPFRNRSKVLYIGASTGTTVSHVSDIVGINGVIFAVESSSRVGRELLENLASKRENIVPILADARKPRSYFSVFGTVDVIYCDIAQPDQTEIAIANCLVYLKPMGTLLLVVKTRSINVLMNPKTVFAQEAKKLKNNKFSIEQIINLEPFDKDHALIRAIYHP
ncbi:MAG TPA: fibrillarin-like rRNA/tRNA 2'-O-methyltransferase [Candidatus Bathyarchaeia archaeon]|nr:fibrillarin-like rRNA/tRNA 2'-O-methyltransferase [Candidatus Bathyarchaeia archaeon]